MDFVVTHKRFINATIRSRKNRENWQRNDATQHKNVATKNGEKLPEREPLGHLIIWFYLSISQY